MIIQEHNKQFYREKYFYRDRAFTIDNHAFGVYSCFDSEFLPGHTSQTSGHFGFYLFYIVTKGEMEDTDPAGHKSILTEGGFSLNPCEFNYTSRAVNGPCIRKCFHLYKTEFTKQLVSLFFPEGYVKLQLPDPEGTERLFVRIREEF